MPAVIRQIIGDVTERMPRRFKDFDRVSGEFEGSSKLLLTRVRSGNAVSLGFRARYARAVVPLELC